METTKKERKIKLLILFTFLFLVIILLNTKVYATSDLRITKKSGGVTENNTTNLISDFTSNWEITSRYGWYVSAPNVGIIGVKVTSQNPTSAFGCKSGTGTLTVTAKRSDISYYPGTPGLIYVDVKERQPGNGSKRLTIRVKPYAQAIHFKSINPNVVAGQVLHLNAYTYTTPENYIGVAHYGTTKWTSSNTNVATVNEKTGYIKFLSGGNNVTVTITVTYSDGKHGTFTRTLKFYVKKPRSDLRIRRIANPNVVDENEEDIIEGFSRTWEIYSPHGWKVYSPNVDIISVYQDPNNNKIEYKALSAYKAFSEEGNVPGRTYIRITENYTGVVRFISINVLPRAEKIGINKEKNFNYQPNNTYSLSAKTSPRNYVGSAGYGSVVWESTYPNVAEVNKNTGALKVKSYGKTKITVTYKAGNNIQKDSFYVDIPDPKITGINIITLPQGFHLGDEFNLKAETFPTDYVSRGESIPGKLIWISTQPRIASIDQSGKMKITGYGQAEITVWYKTSLYEYCSRIHINSVEPPETTDNPSEDYYHTKELTYLSDNRTITTNNGFRITGQRKYNLTDEQKRCLAGIAIRENGGYIDNMRLELSIMANLTERDGWDNVYNYVLYSGWFGGGNQYYSSDVGLDIVEDVLVNGNRYLPTYVDEHDCLSDIVKLTVDGVSKDIYDTNNYIPYKTILYNCYGSVWKFVGFAPNGGDPFGYTGF